MTTQNSRRAARAAMVLFLCLALPTLIMAGSPFDPVLRSVVRLSGSDGSGEPVFGTAFLMQGRGASDEAWLVTAGHLLDRMRGEQVRVGMRREVRGVFYASEVQARIRAGGRPLYHHSPELDLAALKIGLPAEADCCVLARDFAADDGRLDRAGFGSGVRVLIPGYPYGEASGGAGFAFVREGVISSFPVLPAAAQPFFYVDFEVFEGYSGAPVIFSDGSSTGLLAGMVLEEVFLEELRQSGRKTSRTRRGLGLAKVLSGPLIKNFLAALP